MVAKYRAFILRYTLTADDKYEAKRYDGRVHQTYHVYPKTKRSGQHREQMPSRRM